MNAGVDKLQKDGKITKPVKTRNFYGTDVSKQKQKELIEKSDGPFYTNRGKEIPKEDLLALIEASGGGDNPSDTSTIAMDDKGRAIVTFHSDKESTSDIQSNSTLKKESSNTRNLIKESKMSDKSKKKALEIEEKHQKALEKKEEELDTAANGPAREMMKVSDKEMAQILQDAKDDKGIKGKEVTSTKLKASLYSRGKPHPNITPYLKGDGPYSEEQLLRAFYEFAGDDNREGDITDNQKKFLYRTAKQKGHDISKNLGRIREESLQIQRTKHEELNKQSVTLPDGSEKPMGDYIQAQDCINQLHLGVMDGEDGEGVGKHEGLFNVNMGGVVVEEKDLQRCLGVKNTAEFTKGFQVGTPGEGDRYTKNPSTGQITGRNIHRFFVNPETGEKIPIAFKTQRPKQGESSKLNTTMQWSKEMQNCFKGGSKKEERISFKQWIS
jgi:hypothetical protein